MANYFGYLSNFFDNLIISSEFERRNSKKFARLFDRI